MRLWYNKKGEVEVSSSNVLGVQADARYWYDEEGRRIRKVVKIGRCEIDTKYVYDQGGDLILEDIKVRKEGEGGELLYHGQREYVWGRVLGRSIAGSVPVFVKDSVKKISDRMIECFGVVRMSDRGGGVVVEEEVIEDDFSSRPWDARWEYAFLGEGGTPPPNYVLRLTQEGGKLKVEIIREWGE